MFSQITEQSRSKDKTLCRGNIVVKKFDEFEINNPLDN